MADFEIKIYDDCIEIVPHVPIGDNEVYTICFDEVYSSDESERIVNESIDIQTALSPLYASVEAVSSVVDDVDLEDTLVRYYIRESSRFAEYVSGESYGNEAPFHVEQYVKYRAAYDALIKKYAMVSSQGGMEGSLDEITFKYSSNFSGLKGLLGAIKAEYQSWEDHLRGNGSRGNAKPSSAVRGARNTIGSPYGASKKGRYQPGHEYGTTFRYSGYGRGLGR